ncbi:unnamed protein product [Amoebophrya sp. A25]|nr:unnamed protein product [Amoebophrya sp. A25]|eukprot:GSA25T00023618001.1
MRRPQFVRRARTAGGGLCLGHFLSRRDHAVTTLALVESAMCQCELESGPALFQYLLPDFRMVFLGVLVGKQGVRELERMSREKAAFAGSGLPESFGNYLCSRLAIDTLRPLCADDNAKKETSSSTPVVSADENQDVEISAGEQEVPAYGDAHNGDDSDRPYQGRKGTGRKGKGKNKKGKSRRRR